MIAFLNGMLAEKQPARIVVDVGGVGYQLLISLNCYDALPAIGQTVHMLTAFHVREDAQLLFGFLSETERVMFGLLIGVTGVGPKLALSILSGMPTPELRATIAEGNIARLNRLHGVGRKTAERLVLELRDRIDPIEALGETVPESGMAVVQASLTRDALMALGALGFNDEQARKMIKAVLRGGGEPPADAEALVKRALATR